MQKFDVEKEVYRNRIVHLLITLFLMYILLYYIFITDGVLYGVLYSITGEYYTNNELANIRGWILAFLLVITYYILVFIYRTLKGLSTSKTSNDALVLKDGVFYINPPFTSKEIKVKQEYMKKMSYSILGDALYLYFVTVNPKENLGLPHQHEIVVNKRYLNSILNLCEELQIPVKPCKVWYLKEMRFTILNLMKEWYR